MKGAFSLIAGMIALTNVIYYAVQCPSFDCRESIFGIELSGIVYFILWAFMAFGCLYDVYKQNTNKEGTS